MSASQPDQLDRPKLGDQTRSAQPDLIHGSSAEQAAAAPSLSEVEVRKAKTFETSSSAVVADKSMRALILAQTELSGLAQACGWLALSCDTASHQAKLGGILAGLLRVEQRLKLMDENFPAA